ncbi:MAG TPA: VWA domain-containing protein [Myxococcales bacterium]|jgi:Ca-activated chloride channel family protein
MRRLLVLCGIGAGSLALAFALVQSAGIGTPSAALPAAKDVAPEPFLVPSQLPCKDIAVRYEQNKRPPQQEYAQAAESGAAGNVPSKPQMKSKAGGGAPSKALASKSDDVAPTEAEAPSSPPPPPAVAAAQAPMASEKAAPEAKKAAPKPASPALAAKKEQAADKAVAANKPAPKPQQKPAEPPPRPAPQEEPFPTEPTTKYLSADDSNSMASPAIARRLIRARKYVHPDFVRSYEFLNYYSFNFPAPQQGAEVALYPEMRPAAGKNEFNLQIGVRALDRARAEMKPLNVVVLVDVSGSMAGESYQLAKGFVKKLVRALKPGEKISLVSANRTANKLLEGAVVGPDTAAKVDAIVDGIWPTDITNLEAGIAAAYEIAGKTSGASHNSRVIIVSDGAANAGELSTSTIAKGAEDADKQGIYLAGIAVGEGFDDSLMNAVTDKGRGAYVFLDAETEIDKLLTDRAFVSAFDVAVKDVRLKLVLPPGFKVKEFHGEQMSSVASEVVPQYLSPNDQMLYHLVVATNLPQDKLQAAQFEVEAEYRPIGGQLKKVGLKAKAAQMLQSDRGLRKGDAVVRYAETLKKIAYPLEPNRAANTKAIDEGIAYVSDLYDQLKDAELRDILALMKAYRITLTEGEAAELACDKQFDSPPVVLGLRPENVQEVVVRGPAPKQAVKAISRLYQSNRLLPLEGYRMLALATGPVGDPQTTGGQLSGEAFVHPSPKFMGQAPNPRPPGSTVFDLHQVTMKLKAPQNARSFSFDLNYFSAEYPEYVGQAFNDTFLAVLEAKSTNNGAPTNISFDPNGKPIEVNNNYFENKFHPIPNTGTGFDADGSTGWLRTSWPVKGGEIFTLTFSIHDEGDGVYTSLALLDNFQWHEQSAVGCTDPLN